MGVMVNSKVSSNKYVCKTMMALKSNQLHDVIINPEANSIIEQSHEFVKCQ
jgi:hypothetical protein